jgi:hypothetical protein
VHLRARAAAISLAFLAVPLVSAKVREQFWDAFATVAGQRIADILFGQPQSASPTPPVTPSPTAQPAEASSADDPVKAILKCASGVNMDLSADLVGSIRTIFSGEGTKGYASFRTENDFLKLFPESQRLQAYTLYVQCVAPNTGR